MTFRCDLVRWSGAGLGLMVVGRVGLLVWFVVSTTTSLVFLSFLSSFFNIPVSIMHRQSHLHHPKRLTFRSVRPATPWIEPYVCVRTVSCCVVV